MSPRQGGNKPPKNAPKPQNPKSPKGGSKQGEKGAPK